MINSDGEVVGINTAISRRRQSIGFSIAIDSVKALIKDLKKGKGAVAPDQPFFGVQSVDVDSAGPEPDLEGPVRCHRDTGGLHHAGHTEHRGEDAGLEEGDVIVEIEGSDVEGRRMSRTRSRTTSQATGST